MSETIVRSRLCGLKDIYVAEVTANNGTTYTTGTPVKLARALSAKVSDKFTMEKVYSDDNVEDIVEQYEGTDIDFSVNTLAPQDYAKLYENLYKNGFLLKAAGDGAKEIAIGWRAKKRNGICGNTTSIVYGVPSLNTISSGRCRIWKFCDSSNKKQPVGFRMASLS